MTGPLWVQAVAASAVWVAVLAWPGVEESRSERPSRWLAVRRRAVGLRQMAAGRWARRAGAVRRRQEQSLLTVVDSLAPALEAGLPAAMALGHAAGAAADPGVQALLLDAAGAASAGSPPGEALAAAVRDARGVERAAVGAGAALLARAWSLADELGTPLANATATVGAVVRADLAARRATEAAVAEARASVRVLLLLPILGPGMALAVGASPTELYGSLPAAGSAVAGLALAVAGRTWMARLTERVAESAEAAETP